MEHLADLTGNFESRTDALREAYVALSRNDIAGFVAMFDPQIERIEFEGTPMAGAFRGLEAVTEHVATGRSTWAEGSCVPERFLAAGDNVVVFVHVRVRLNGETEWIDGRTVDVFTFGGGKVIQFRSFLDKQQALDWAGVEETADTRS